MTRRTKPALRRIILKRRKARPEPERAVDDAARFTLIRDFLADQRLNTAAIYLSAPPEPSTRPLIDWLAARNVRVLLPVLTEPANDDEITGPPDWAPYAGPNRLRQGRLSITEPDTKPVGAGGLRAAQLIVSPGLAGNDQGHRLGRGGGWYDRALAEAGPGALTIMPLNDDELYEHIPVDHWDRRVDVIATPHRMITCSAPASR